MLNEKMNLEITKEEANLIILSLHELLNKVEHGSEKIALADSIYNAIADGHANTCFDSNDKYN